MTRQQLREYTSFVEHFSKEARITVDEAGYYACMLHRYEATLHRLAENACNGWPRPTTEVREGKTYRFDVEDVKWRARDEAKEARTEHLVIALLSQFKTIKVEFGGDPRGCAISLTFTRTKWTNGWGGNVVIDW